MQAKDVVIIRLDLSPSRQPSNLGGRSMIDLADARVEPSNTTESRGQRNLTHWQIRFVDQFLCEMQAARLSHRNRSSAQMFQKQAPQVPRPNSQSLRQNLYSSVFESALADQTQRP